MRYATKLDDYSPPYTTESLHQDVRRNRTTPAKALEILKTVRGFMDVLIETEDDEKRIKAVQNLEKYLVLGWSSIVNLAVLSAISKEERDDYWNDYVDPHEQMEEIKRKFSK